MAFSPISNTFFLSKPAALVSASSNRIHVFCIARGDQRIRHLTEGGRISGNTELFSEVPENQNLSSNHKFIDHPIALRIRGRSGMQLFALEETKRGIFITKPDSNFEWEGFFQGGGLIGGAEISGAAILSGGRPLLATTTISNGKKIILGRHSDESGSSLSGAFQIGAPSQNIAFSGRPIFGQRPGGISLFARDSQGSVFECGVSSAAANLPWANVGNRAIGQRPFQRAHGDLTITPDGLVLHAVDNQGNLHIVRRTQFEGWGLWEQVAEGLLPSSQVAVADDLRGRYLIAHFRDGNLYYKYFYRRGSLSSEWILIGRAKQGVSAVVSPRDNKLKIFARADSDLLSMASGSYLDELIRSPYIAYHNGFWGILKFNTFDLIDNTFTGEAYGDAISGNFNPETREFTFQRQSQTWKFTLGELRALQGTMTQDGNTNVFSWSAKKERIVSIKTFSGKYWRNSSVESVPLMAVSDAPMPFSMEAHPDGFITIRGSQFYITAENGGGGMVKINRHAIGDWERFILNGIGNGQAGFQAMLSRIFLTAEDAGGAAIVANRPANNRRAWETFDVKDY